jgi:hypothetical protein
MSLTVATASLLVAQVTGISLRAGVEATTNCALSPGSTVAASGEIRICVTGGSVTVTVAVAVAPSLVAIIVARPPDTPVTTPMSLTVATASLLVVQVTGKS